MDSTCRRGLKGKKNRHEKQEAHRIDTDNKDTSVFIRPKSHNQAGTVKGIVRQHQATFELIEKTMRGKIE